MTQTGKRVDPASSFAGSSEVEKVRKVSDRPKCRHSPSQWNHPKTKSHRDRELREGMEWEERNRFAPEIEGREARLHRHRTVDRQLSRCRPQLEQRRPLDQSAQIRRPESRERRDQRNAQHHEEGEKCQTRRVTHCLCLLQRQVIRLSPEKEVQ